MGVCQGITLRLNRGTAGYLFLLRITFCAARQSKVYQSLPIRFTSLTLLTQDLHQLIARLPLLTWPREDTQEQFRLLNGPEGLPEAALLKLLVKCRCGRVLARGAISVHVCGPLADRTVVDLTLDD